jgi:cAMP phosphodiesterase
MLKFVAEALILLATPEIPTKQLFWYHLTGIYLIKNIFLLQKLINIVKIFNIRFIKIFWNYTYECH